MGTLVLCWQLHSEAIHLQPLIWECLTAVDGLDTLPDSGPHRNNPITTDECRLSYWLKRLPLAVIKGQVVRERVGPQ